MQKPFLERAGTSLVGFRQRNLVAALQSDQKRRVVRHTVVTHRAIHRHAHALHESTRVDVTSKTIKPVMLIHEEASQLVCL